MTLKITSPYRHREKILSFGGPGAGKTYDYFTIAKHVTGTLYVLDMDDTADHFLESDEFASLDEEGRVEVYQPYEWEEIVANVKEIRGKVKKDDWVAVDMMNTPWNEVQRYFTERVFGMDQGEFWTQYLADLNKSGGKGSKTPFDGQTDWQAIKAQYARFTRPLWTMPCHLYLAAPEKNLAHHEAEATKDLFGKLGWKPDCEKSTPHATRTVLRKFRQRVTTVKDRQREKLTGVKINNFAFDYLVKVGKWMPMPNGGEEG